MMDITNRLRLCTYCLQATVEHVSQAALFLEDAGDLSQALNRDVDEMSMDEQVSDLSQVKPFTYFALE